MKISMNQNYRISPKYWAKLRFFKTKNLLPDFGLSPKSLILEKTRGLIPITHQNVAYFRFAQSTPFAVISAFFKFFITVFLLSILLNSVPTILSPLLHLQGLPHYFKGISQPKYGKQYS
jgi:hypothetical protein